MSGQEIDSRVEKKRRVILTIALETFAKEGFRNTDVQVIADLAKVGKGTVYRHFGNKQQLFLATARDCQERMGAFIETSLGEPDEVPHLLETLGTIEILKRIAEAFARFYEQQPLAVEIMIQERAEFRESVFPSHLMFRAETRAGFEGMLRAAMDRGELRQLDAVRTTDAFADLIYGSVVNGCLDGTKRNLVERVRFAVDVFLNGLTLNAMSAEKHCE